MLTRLSAAQIVESEDRVWQRFRANPPKLGGKGEDEDSDWLEIRSALRDVAASDPELKIQNAELHKLIRGRIVIIGGSYTDARDTYRTPIGWMPGAIILANAIHSLRTFGPLRPPEFWTQKLPLIVFSVLLVGLSFHFLPVAVATLLALPAVLLVTFLLSTLWIQSGVWVDATAGCAAIVVHRFYEDGKHAIAWVLGKGVSTHGS
jgi:CHASE2 domain-containing sensor protein